MPRTGVGCAAGRRGQAYPFQSMGRLGAAGVINDATGGVDIVVVWDRDSNIALPVREVAGQSLTFDIGKGECMAPGPARPRDRNLVKRGRRSCWKARFAANGSPRYRPTTASGSRR